MWWCSGKKGERLGYKRSEFDPELRFSFLFYKKKNEKKKLSITVQKFLSVSKKAATVNERDNYGAETVIFFNTADNCELICRKRSYYGENKVKESLLPINCST